MNEKMPKILTVGVWVLILSGLYLSSLQNYLLFHSLAEIFSIVIGCGIFMVAWNSRRFLDNDYLLFLGCAYLFIAFIDLTHTLAYKGMRIFPDDANFATQLWIGARYMESISLLVAPFFLTRRLRTGLVCTLYFSLTSALLFSILYWPVFPDCFIEGRGLTPFKKTSEYVISLILAGALVILVKHRHAFDRKVLRFIAASILVTILSELAFVFYVSVYGFSNLLGHFGKIISFYLIYKAVIEKGLREPYQLFFRNLKRSEEELRLRTAEIEEANRDLESFCYSVSHDLKAPLRAISGFARILTATQAGNLSEEGKRLLNLIGSNAVKMGRLIDDILLFSRAGRGDIKMAPVDMEELAQSVIDEIRSANPGRNLHFEIGGLPPAVSDPSTIKQVLANLLSNAVKFTCLREEAVITVQGVEAGNEVIYTVRDNGVGFDERYAERLFGLFQRLHHDEDFEGTGIGLAMVKRFIDKLGGRIWAEGKVNEGAAFHFSLPRMKEEV